jgi:hypothetical protein
MENSHWPCRRFVHEKYAHGVCKQTIQFFGKDDWFLFFIEHSHMHHVFTLNGSSRSRKLEKLEKRGTKIFEGRIANGHAETRGHADRSRRLRGTVDFASTAQYQSIMRRITRLSLFALFLVFAIASGCVSAGSRARMTEDGVVGAAKAATNARFPNAVAAHEPYHSEFRKGLWSVWGTSPDDVLGGGAPEAIVRDSDGKATEIYLSK